VSNPKPTEDRTHGEGELGAVTADGSRSLKPKRDLRTFWRIHDGEAVEEKPACL